MRALCLAACLALALAAHAQERGKAVYEKTCALCHAAGIAGAPKIGASADWEPRLGRGTKVLYTTALTGTPRGMPARGGNLDLKEEEVRAAVDYMLGRLPARKPVPAAKSAAAPGATPAPTPTAAALPPVATASVPVARAADEDVNTFNRLLRPPALRNPPPARDGIHDPAAEGTNQLQAPLAAYAGLPRSNAGNRVDWVQALAQKKIAPRWDRADPQATGLVMDLNIVREVKGSMPDVVYPHKQHTEWLDCSNCHPAIFVPQKGANPISMAAILMGQACGTCHGKVAFPVSECRLCHSKKKDLSVAKP